MLILPFVARLPSTESRLLPSLLVYIGVVVYSALLATWYLVLDPRTRGRSRRADAP